MNKAFTVSQVNRYIKRLLEEDALLYELQVEGEISNFKHHSSGHLYFTLKDAGAAINCVMFSSYASGLSFKPANGDKIIISGNVSLYEKTGQYQLYAINIKPAGAGDLANAFDKLMKALQAEGLFDPEKKQAIPEWAACVALVTSPTGAAVQDMIKVIRSRNPSVKIVIVPCLVQGDQASADIARAITLVNEWAKADVIIVGRGGGSTEDLWAFNEEIVARAIANSKIPIISAVGHETDFTIADFAADYRAATPSAAAAVAVADVSEQMLLAKVLRQRMDRAIGHSVVMKRMQLQQLEIKAKNLIPSRLQDIRNNLNRQTELLKVLSPYALWKRGYGLICDETGVGLRSVKDLSPGQLVGLKLQDGEAEAQIMNVRPN